MYFFPLDKGDVELVDRLSLQGIQAFWGGSKRGRHRNKRVQWIGRWMPPPVGVIKINTDGSSRENPGPARISGVARDSGGSVRFTFSIHEGEQTVNLMEGLAILYALERACALGYQRVICEADS